jgi:hypothetical protein
MLLTSRRKKKEQMQSAEIDAKLKLAYSSAKRTCTIVNQLLNMRTSSRYDELHKLTDGLQTFIHDYEKWKEVKENE